MVELSWTHLAGLANTSIGAAGWIPVFDVWIPYLGRIIGTCVVLYGFFHYRLLGAGDIKLMALCVGVLGIDRGLLVIFCGLLAVLAFEWWKESRRIGLPVWEIRYVCLKGRAVRLAPYLFGSYAAWLLCGGMK